jgi:hypothetical protein
MRWHIAVLLVAIGLTGCATKYQEMGFSGGVSAQQITQDTFRIVARGNGYTAGTTVQDYALLKAAETTKQMGGTHFAVVSAANASTTGSITTPGTAQTSVIGNTAFTTYNSGTTVNFIKPGQDVYIRVLKVPPGSPTPPGAIAAEEIITFVGSRVARVSS